MDFRFLVRCSFLGSFLLVVHPPPQVFYDVTASTCSIIQISQDFLLTQFAVHERLELLFERFGPGAVEEPHEASEGLAGEVRVGGLLPGAVVGDVQAVLIAVAPDALQISVDVDALPVGYAELLQPAGEGLSSRVVVEETPVVSLLSLVLEPLVGECGDVSYVLFAENPSFGPLGIDPPLLLELVGSYELHRS